MSDVRRLGRPERYARGRRAAVLAAAVAVFTPVPSVAGTSWTVATVPAAGDIAVCAHEAETAFAAMGMPTTRQTVSGNGIEIFVVAKHPGLSMRLTAYCRPNQFLVLLGGFDGGKAELEAARDRFKAEFAVARTASRTPVRPPATTNPITYPGSISGDIKFFGSTADCFAESRPMLTGAGYRVHGELDNRLMIGATSDTRYFAVVDCATTHRTDDHSIVKVRMAVAPDVTREARDAEARRLGGLLWSSAAERARAEASFQRWNAEQVRIQEAQAREVSRMVQAEADAAYWNGGATGAPRMTLDEDEIARAAASAIQAGRATGSSDGAIIMEHLPPPPEYVPGPAYQAPPPPEWATTVYPDPAEPQGCGSAVSCGPSAVSSQ